VSGCAVAPGPAYGYDYGAGLGVDIINPTVTTTVDGVPATVSAPTAAAADVVSPLVVAVASVASTRSEARRLGEARRLFRPAEVAAVAVDMAEAGGGVSGLSRRVARTTIRATRDPLRRHGSACPGHLSRHVLE